MNEINVITPYVYNGILVFDDEKLGAHREALICGSETILIAGAKLNGIPNPENGFNLIFSGNPFPEWQMVAKWVKGDGKHGWNWYEVDVNGQKALGGLCPFLGKFFSELPEPPKHIYLKFAPAPADFKIPESPKSSNVGMIEELSLAIFSALKSEGMLVDVEADKVLDVIYTTVNSRVRFV